MAKKAKAKKAKFKKRPKNIMEMTRKDFDALPSRGWNEDVGEMDSLVLLPTRRMHDSGFRVFEVVGVKGGMATCKLTGGSDVINLGDNVLDIGNLREPQAVRWDIDCLPKSGLFQVFAKRCRFRVGHGLSSFGVEAVRRPE